MNSQYFINGKKITIVDSKDQGIPANIKTGYLPNRQWVIIKDRKSRIIMKDGHIIREQGKIVIDIVGAKAVCLGTTASVCSKTKLFLEESNIAVFSLDRIQK